jgi:hypothetical protein
LLDSPGSENPRAVPEIREAVALFEAWERSINDLQAAKGFSEAVRILDDYLECEPASPHRAFIQNLRLSNTRRLLQQLTRLDRTDFSLWLEYALAVLAAVDNEAESVIAANPELKKDLDSFKHVWGDALAQALKRVQNSEG